MRHSTPWILSVIPPYYPTDLVSSNEDDEQNRPGHHLHVSHLSETYWPC